MKQLPQLLFTLLFTVGSISAQGVGGQTETLYQWQGSHSNDVYGNVVSAAGDVNADGCDDLIVGAFSLYEAGKAFVYSGVDGSLLYQWTGSGPQSDLGVSVADAGDINGDGFADVMVGDTKADSGGLAQPGAVFVYSGADGSVLLRLDGSVPYGYFGFSVSSAGDVNRDSIPDIIVGSYDRHAVTVFSGADGSLLFNLGVVGTSVSDAGDINGDGYADVLVGSFLATPGGVYSAGSTYLFSGRDGSQLYQWNGNSYDGRFGMSVSNAGDVSGDGIHDIVVGEPQAAPGGLYHAGSAYVFSGADGSLLFRWDGETEWDLFGESVSDAGDINQDGFDDILIGAYWASPVAYSSEGSAYLFSGVDGVLLHRWDGTTYGDTFGASVSSAGDVNGNGTPELVISQTYQSQAAIAGVVYVYSFTPQLQSNTNFLSASAGGQMDLEMDFPDSAAGYGYKMLLSAAPRGQMFRGTGIPLAEDFMVHKTYYGFYPFATYSNLHGVLDAAGDATAGIQLAPSELHPSWVGRTFHIAVAASLNSFSPAEYCSIAVPIFIRP